MRALALILPLLVGCAVPLADSPRPTPGVVEARMGEAARLGELSVRPLSVLEDSRCPRDVTCVWAGRLRLRVALVPGGQIELELGQPHALPEGAGTLTLVTAAPEPWQNPPPGVAAGGAVRFGFRRD